MSDARSNWSSKTGMILAATGSAVGLGAIWKFPYMAGANGGSAFIIPFILMVLFFGVTLILAEIIIGEPDEEVPSRVSAASEASSGLL